MTTYTLRGRIETALPNSRVDPLAGATVRLYRVEESASRALAARAKETFAILDEAAVDRRAKALLGEAETDEEGRFTVGIDDDGYDGEPVELHVRVDGAGGLTSDEPVQAGVTVVGPRWRKSEDGPVAAVDHTLSRANWCAILEALGLWLVAGRVTVSGSGDPAGGATVTAKDRDLLQDDTLGSDTTDADGLFAIYYQTAAFEATPSWWNPPVELVPGADLYFSIEWEGETQAEEPSRGRDPDRENADRCEYVKLQVDAVTPEPGPEQTPTVPTYWQRIGSAFDVPQVTGSLVGSAFDADGYAGSSRFALTGNITLEGSAPLHYTGALDSFVEYRVLVSESPTANGGAPPASSTFEPVGVGVDQRYVDAFVPTTVGYVRAYDPAVAHQVSVPVRIQTSHQDSAGWISVHEAADDALTSRFGTDLAGLVAANRYFGWNDADPLAAVDTSQFTTTASVADAAADAGVDVPAAGETVDPSLRAPSEEAVALRFEARVVDAARNPVAAVDAANYVQSGLTLNRVVVNNTPAFGAFVNEGHATDDCAPLAGDVTFAYTVYHPHLRSVTVDLERNDDADDRLNDPTNAVSFTGEPNPGDHFANPGLVVGANTSVLTKPCAYRAVCRLQRRLHTGYSAVDSSLRTVDDSLFYWGAAP